MSRVPTGSGLVGLMVDPGPQLLVGLLGILKSGSGFVPLDPNHPPDRLALMAKDCSLEVLITESAHLERAREVAQRCARLQHLVCLDDIAEPQSSGEDGGIRVHALELSAAGAAPASRPAPVPETPVYVIYTSGSTGTPKGVPIHHRNLMPLLAWSGEAFGFREETRVLQSLSHSFDFGIFEILTTLLYGGLLVMLNRRERGDTELYLETVKRHRINTIHTTPSFFREVATASRGELAGLEILHLGGEALTEPLLEQAFSVVGERCVLYNGYGPTEATINCSLYRVGRRDEPRPKESAAVPIGRASAHHHLVVLGGGGRLAPVGASGELAVGGVSVAQGYHGRPRLTAEKFVPDPFAERLASPGGRLYLTGDLVRYRREGQLEFLGRIDHQVKIRGFRIEPDEVAAVLADHPGVREAAVIPRPGLDGNARLVAYVVPAAVSPAAVLPAEKGQANGWRPYLGERLPHYMVPAAFVELEALPLTPNGKLDRRALPEPPAQTLRPEGFVAPQSPLEELVAGVCCELLGLEEISVVDDLFELGCHSLIAMQIVARLRESLAIELPLVCLFEAPSVAGLAAAAEQASATADSGRLPPVEPAPRDGEIPLSFSQERLWFLQQLDPLSAAYIVPRALALRGGVQIAILERAYNEIVRRHEILRTSFPDIGGRPVQVIHPPAPIAMPRVDLSALPRERRDELVDKLILGEGQRPFDFERGPLIRFLLVLPADDEHVLVQSEHHLVHDGWTQSVLARELLTLYRAFLADRPSPLPELPIQYADFAIWQRRWLRDEVLEDQLGYWRRQLAGAPAVLDLPFDRPRPKVQTHRGGQIEFDLPAGLAGALRALSRRRSATLFMILEAAFTALLRRYTGRDDLVVGTGIANRRAREVESLIGMVINTLVLRTDAGGDPTFEQLLDRVRTVCLEAYAHQDVPFERVVDALNVPRSRSHAPIFQVLFAFMDAPMPLLELPGLELDALGFHNRSSKFDVNVVVIPHAEQRVGTDAEDSGELTFHWEYASDLFDVTTMQRMVGHYCTLLASLVRTPEARLSELEILGAGERAQLLVEWNDTSSAYPRRSLTDLFAEYAALYPDAPAVKAADGTELSYSELERRAHRLAHHLVDLGVGPEVPVALCLERSVEMVVAILAVLEAGGVYVPLDPGHPRERQRLLLEETGALLVLTDERRRAAVPELDAVGVVSLDRDAAAIAGRPSSAVAGVAADPDRLAYTMYTSGSTGRPKGVAVSQAGVVRLVRETNYVRLGPGDRIGHLANPAFDASTYEIWGALLTGACVVVLPRETVIDPPAFAAILKREKITSAFVTTALFNQTAAVFPDAFAGFSELLVGGDAVDPGAARQVLGAGPPARLLNGYGPTESTTFAVWHRIRTVAAGDRTVPIGRPIANTRLHVVDRNFALVPTGVPGQLCLAGDGLARGYFGQGARTAEKFVPDPFNGPGGRLYLTGDLARHRAGGVVELMGRIDKQVKIRGFRIELGEVEAVLSGLATVREAAVVVRDEAPFGKRLVAYVVGTDGSPDFNALRAELGAVLPDYMLPAAFVSLEALPLTPNCKLDRAALPAPPAPAAKTEAELPATPHEELVAGLWAEVMGLETVGRYDDFFEAGGHSLLATQVVSRLREAFDVELDLRRFFEARTVAALAAVIEAAAQERAAPPLAPAARDGELPLSFAQERMWILHQLDPESVVYNVPAAMRFRGSLRPALLAASLSEIVRRHEALRTTFANVDGRPVQVVRSASAVTLAVVDLGALSEERREMESRRVLAAETRRPFDLGGTALLVRALLVRLGEHEHVALLTMHHIVSDGWSMGILMREVAALYRAAARGERSPLRELAVQYADFAVWQRQWLDGAELERQLGYWRAQLAGVPVLELPIDRPRQEVSERRGARLALTLPATLRDDLAKLSRQSGATSFMTLLAGLTALLSRFSGQRDIAVGAPIAGRRQLEAETLVGFFVNTLVLRNRIAGKPMFDELLADVRRTTLDAYAHQDVPFEKLVEELRPERSLSVSPLFQVSFIFQNTPREPLALPDLELVPEPVDIVTAKFDLSLSLQDEEGRLGGTLVYDRGLFDTTTAQRLLRHYVALLTAVVETPGQPLADLDLLSAAEKSQLLREWNDTASAWPRSTSIHLLFAAQAATTPEAVAVEAVEDGEQLTYRGLDERANRLARHLVGLGVGPEVPVGLYLERSVDMVVATLAILKAGGIYVPLDPKYPRERLRFMVHDSGAPVVVTHSGWLEALSLSRDLGEGALPGDTGVHAVCLDSEREAIAAQSEAALASAVGLSHLAFVMYTSGSTGRPKGVAVPHAGVLRLVRETRWADLGPQEIFLQIVPISFDVATLEIWGALLNGGRLVVPPAETPSFEELGRIVERHRISTLHLTAGLFHQMVEHHLEGLRPVRQLLAGGDVLSPVQVRRVLAELPQTRLINCYGPTENTTLTTTHLVSAGEAWETVPVGRPIANTEVYVVDDELRAVAVGVVGELGTTGAGLARGYFGRAALTAARFVPDPFGDPGGRLYRIGDLARYRADGTVEFLGRMDHQVKVRGFRIELGEVEAVLHDLEDVRSAAVVARDDAPGGGKWLVAYVVAANGAVDTEALRRELESHLPGYMVPGAFVELEALPLTANGKLDRRALPAPVWDESERQLTQPRTQEEELLCGIWCEVLGQESVGIEEDFFDLGGHSLIATQLISRIRERLEVELPLRAIFETPTVAGLASSVVAARSGGLQAPSVVPVSREGELPLSFSQRRLWFLDQLQPDNPQYNLPGAAAFHGRLDVAALLRSLREIAVRHEVLRTVFPSRDGKPEQVIRPAPDLPLPCLDLSALPSGRREDELRRLLREEAGRPFKLACGPLWRVRLLRLSGDEHVLVSNLHHIVSDGWSSGLLIRELMDLYGTFSAGRPSPLEALGVQYADYAVWQRQWLTDERLAAEIDYWRQKLAGAPPELALPTDRPRPQVPSRRGRLERFALPESLVEDLRALCRREGVTLFMALTAGFQALLARYCDQDDISIGTPIAGRSRLEIEELIGFFVNMLVLRTDLSDPTATDDPTFRELLRRVRETALEAHAHQDLPLERLVEALQPERSLDTTPFFQVVFAFQNAPSERLDVPGLSVEPLELEVGTSRFDLSLVLSEPEMASGGLAGSLEFSLDLFDASTVRRLHGHLRTLLSGVVADASTRLSALPLLSAPEQFQILREWSGGRVDYDRELCAHEGFSAQVARRGDEVAAIFVGNGETLTYAELERASNQLAHVLRCRGVGPDEPVAICVERSLEMVVGVLGILKAGGYYVPLDPEYPASRRSALITAVDARVVVVQEHLAADLEETGAQLLRLSRDLSWLAAEPETPPDVDVNPRCLAYVMFTSGSTGRPKGVAVCHRSIVCMAPDLGFPDFEAETFLQLAPLSFDASTLEIWGAFLNGGRLVIHPPERPSLEDLGACIADYGVSALWLTAGLFHQMVDGPLESLRGVRHLMSGGDVLSTAHVRKALAAYPGARMINGYGPTENTVFTTCRPLTSTADVGRTVSIGRPTANSFVYVLDRRARPVPVGVAGELCVGGDGLARGYYGNPRLTASRIVPDPNSATFGERLYRTGDLVRHRAEGEIEFLGRFDDQVKVRGFRVELGEIEAALADHPGVAGAAVVVQSAESGDKRLVGWWAPEAGWEPEPEELRSFLASRLPDAFLPSLLKRLEELPLTPRGKVDRKALARRSVDLSAELETEAVEAPRGPVEELLAGLFADVLGVDTPGREVNFFDLGGHSLLATQLISRLRKAFSLELPLRILFEKPTVAELAAVVEEEMSAGRELQVPPVVPVPRDGALPLSFAQQRLWFLDQLQPGNPFYNVPFAVRLSGRLDVGALERALLEVVRRHEVLRTVYPRRGGQPLQEIVPALVAPLPRVDLTALPAELCAAEVSRLVRTEARRSFDLARGPLYRSVLLKAENGEHVLFTNQHHIVSDGWSVGLQLREVAALYSAFRDGRPAPLAELPIQYADFAHWQRQWMEADGMEQQLAYWRRQLGDLPATLALPMDRPRPMMPSFRGRAESCELAGPLVEGLRALGREAGTTLFMTLLAAFQTLLARYSGQLDVSVGTPIAGRNRLEIEDLIGFFVNTVVLRTRFSGRLSFRELLGRVRETALEAHANRDLPFERLVEELRPERSLNTTPLFHVWFTLQNVPLTAAQLPDLEMTSIKICTETSKFDLTLSLAEKDEAVAGELEYATDLFDEATVKRLLEHFETLLTEIVADPERRLWQLPLLGEAGRRELLVKRNQTTASYPREPMARLLAAEAARHPEAVALVFGEREMSYAELERRASQVARCLADQGVGPGQRVGIYLEHGLVPVVAILGALKAGAAYVPLDPGHPPRQTSFIVRDSALALVITEPALVDQLEGVPIACLDDRWELLDGYAETSPPMVSMPEDPAYVIYTSGSTGTPKGVEVPQGALVDYAWWAKKVYVRGEEVSFALYSSFAFDLTITSLFPPLLSGSRIVIYRARRKEPVLLEVIRDDQVEVLKLTPSHLALLRGHDFTATRIRLLVVGGEALNTELALKVRESFGSEVEILNEYGPTEATVGCMLHRFDPARDQTVGVPIGLPAANTRIYVLDEHLEPVAENVTGEIYLAGDGLASGYVSRAVKTASSFLPDIRVEGARMYRTGDLARWLSSGVLLYEGRRDEQVKFHGYRVELEGISSVLNEHPKVRNSVVALVREGEGEVSVAYYVARHALDVGELHAFLADRIIEETVPNLFIHLRRMPLTLNGKVNYAALPPIGEARKQMEREILAPRSSTEEGLAKIWMEVLGLERVGVEESFFTLGGHSLLATQVISHIREMFGAELELRVLFEAPTVAGLAVAVESEMRDVDGPRLPPIERVPRDGPLYLSSAQRRLWLVDQMDPGTATYNVPVAVHFEGHLQVAVLARAFREIVRRQEVLRTTFEKVADEPVQRIHPPAPVSLPEIDLRALPEPLRSREADRLLDEERRRPFDLRCGPLLYLRLLWLDEAAGVVLMTMHHIVSDGWSMGILVRELGALYKAFAAGRPSPLPELDVQYADFAQWERRWLSEEALGTQIEYWRSRLSGFSVPDLPADHPRSDKPSGSAGHCYVELPRELVNDLREISHARGMTLFMTLLAGLQGLLSRYTGQHDVPVGSVIAGRNQLHVQGLIGFFVNTLVLKTDLGGDPSWEEALGRARTTTLAAYAHQDVPYEKVVEELRIEHGSSLFQVMLALQNAPFEPLDIPGLHLEPVELARNAAKFDLTVALREPEGERSPLRGSLEYRRDLFDRTTVLRLWSHLSTLLEEIVTDPSRRLSEVMILSPAERHQVAVEWNATTTSYPRESTLVELFEAQARRAPAAVAVVFERADGGEERLTYAELDRRSNQLGRHLRRHGSFLRDALVGVCVERSVEMVVGFLGILKAGAAYLPLDPSYPKDRLAFMVEDTGTRVILTQERWAEKLPVSEAEVIRLDEDWETVARKSDKPLDSAADARSLAYVIYTSGSTGTPKGVAVPQRAVVRLVVDTDYVELGPKNRVAQASNASFDAATFEIWGALLNGATLWGIPQEVVLRADQLVARIREHRIDTLFLTTALFNQIARERPDGFATLRSVLFGGEAVSPVWVRTVLENWAPQRLLHVYGPTENTTFSTWYPVREVPAGALTVPIGRAIANSRCYVLDPALAPVPIGVPGELHLGGDGLAREYLHRPEETRQAFVESPWWPGERLYKTGDVVRYRRGGEIEFIGRVDQQVKLRGFRIELGEVEATLGHHPAVARTVAMVCETSSGDNRLVAWIVPHEGREVDALELREHLAKRLPPYMVPAAFVGMESFPLNPNGKVDREVLLRDALPGLESDPGAEALPRKPLEEMLVGIWSELLDRETVGIHDDFFELGGHSLVATRVVSRVRQVFGVEIPLRALFVASTVAALAREIESAKGTVVAPPLVTVSRDEPLRLSHAQERLWFLDRLDPGSAAYNVFAAVRLTGTLRPEALRAAFDVIVHRHEALRTTFADAGDGPVQIIHPSAAFELPTVDLRRLPPTRRETETRRRLEAAARRPFDLERGPLVRVLLLRTDDEEHLALLLIHHIVSDGWSMGVLVREIAELYRAAILSEPARLPELPFQYADFAAWQRAWLEAGELDRQLAFWRQELDGVPVLELTGDRPRPTTPSLRGAGLSIRLDANLAAALRSLARSEGATLFMTLLTGYATLLSRLTGQRDVAIGSPIAGRGRLETEGLIGFFVNTLVPRADLGHRPSFTELLRRLRRCALDAYDHQDVPFEKLVEVLQPERDMATSPLFQVVFALQNAPFDKLALSELTLEEIALESATAKFDLTLSLTEDADGGLSGFLEFACDLFDPTTVRRFARHFDALLHAAVAEPGSRFDELPILGPVERYQLFHEWNDTAAALPEASLSALFATQVAAHPDTIAVVEAATGDRLTYQQLAERARRLAHELVELGVGSEVPVGLCLERSIEMIVATLAILEAGGVYVPLDPSYPEERLRFMIDVVRAPVVLTLERFVDTLPELAAVRIVALDREAEAIAAREASPLDVPIRAESLAYVMYTSGSTGWPKGVAVCHAAVVRLVCETDDLDCSSDQVFLLYAPISFDAATFEIWGPLLNGGRLVIAPPGRISIEEIGRTLTEHGVTSLWLTAGLFHEMVEHHPEALRSVRQLVAGGDVLSPSHVRTALEKLPETTLVNGYGPTENTTFTCCCKLSLAEASDRPVPIGQPIANTQVHLLDPQLRPVPAGVPGQLAAAGVGLARGYFRRPALTAEYFVPNPQGDGERLYLTGDLARRRNDATVEFLGRIDHQVKIRGFRIEPSEVESTIGSLAAVRAAVVTVRDGASGEDKRLVAHVVPAAAELTARELTQELAKRLPAHMLPSAVVFLDEMPLNPNGKVDRAALPDPERKASAAEHVVPRTPTEELVLGIWQEVLSLDAIGLDDDFFELGGHSLNATRVVSRLRQVFGVEIPLRVLFAGPTIAALAREVDLSRDVDAAGEPAAPPLGKVDRDAPLPLSFAQQRLWFLHQLAPESWAYNVPQALSLRCALVPGALAAALRATVERHEALRTAFAALNGEPVQKIFEEFDLDLALVDLSALDTPRQEAALDAAIDAESHRPFDLAKAPLLRGLLLRRGEENHVLRLTLHHISCDGWSLGILMREVAEHYRAALSGGQPNLPELPIQYADYAVWQRRTLQGEALERHLDYWRRQLGQEPPVLDLPRDRPLPERPSDRGATRPMPFGPELSRDLMELARSEDVTPFMILLAGLKAFLSAYSAGDSIVVGTDIAGRNRVEVEGLIGFFINILPLHTDLGGDPTFRELLARVRETTLDGYAHQDLPFDKLVEELQPQRSLGETPFFQVLFVLQNMPEGTFHLPELELESMVTPVTSSKFELMLVAREIDGGVAGIWVYRTELYDESTIDRLAATFSSVLDLAVADPDVPVRQLAESVRAAAPRRAPVRARAGRRRGIKLRTDSCHPVTDDGPRGPNERNEARK